jgi:hypothetical protein
MPAYVDPYAYVGVFNIQITEKIWPATAGLIEDQLTPLQVLEKSAEGSFDPSR